MDNPTELHLRVAKRVLRYLRGTSLESSTGRKETVSLSLIMTAIMEGTWMIGKVLRVIFS